MRIAEIMHGEVLALEPHATVREASLFMTERRCGAILIISERKLLGIFSERDLMNRIVSPRLDPDKTLLGSVMTRDVLTISPDMGADEAMRLMYLKRLRHLPVVDAAGIPLGMLGLRDMMDFIVRGLFGER